MKMRTSLVMILVLLMGSGLMAQNMNDVLDDLQDESWQAAYDKLEVLMRKKPKNIEYKFFAGICLAELYRPDESIPLFLASADFAKESPFYYVKFAKAYLLAGQVQKAKNTFARFSSRDLFEEDKKEYNLVKQNIFAAEKYLPIPKDIIVQNLGDKVNTEGSEYSPLMTHDHKGIFFTARRVKESEKARDGEAYEQVMTTNMDEYDDWIQDEVLDGYAKGTDHDATVQLMNNDSTLVSFKNEDLYISDLQADGTWGNRRGIGNINTGKWESHVYFYNNGNNMIYATAAGTKDGNLDLYIATKDARGKWGKGKAITELNTVENDDSPYVAEDGTLFFASRGHESMGGYDIFQTRYDSATGTFTPPENLGAPINTVNDDTFFSVYGKMAYLASYRPGGFGSMDIYKIYMFKKTVVAGRLLDCENQRPIAGASISVEGEEQEYSTVTDQNGFYKMELPIERDFMLNVVKGGNSLYKQKHYVKVLFRDETDVMKDFMIGCQMEDKSEERIIIKLKNGWDLNPSEIAVEPPAVEEVTPEEVVAEVEEVEAVEAVEEAKEVEKEEEPEVVAKEVIADTPDKDISTQTMPMLDEIELPIVYFDFDKHNIKEEFFQRLNEAAQLLKDRPDVRVLLSGHTDNYGTNEYNVALGQRRYNEVHNYLVSKGVNPAQLETDTFGEESPAQNNRTRRGRALNRRVVLSFIQ